MLKETTRANVKSELLTQCGVKPESIDRLINEGSELIKQGRTLRSYAYYVAGQILENFATDEDIIPDFIPPDEEDDDDNDD